MLIKLVLRPQELDALHLALADPRNKYVFRGCEPSATRCFVRIKSATAQEQPTGGTGSDQVPTMPYNVTLEVTEDYTPDGINWRPVPLLKLAPILQAIGLFPNS
jgi:hypothetical protein